ncbi:hypothetical protein [Microbacterium sp. SS28]|uniref:hypothetical protein n=1 Tax=Microbacterium sp. SS28 TaxID=2919948 RepID=UPI001FAAEDAF|nr:hypothetical protein [Microbacterium sp. SS28]
MASPRRLRMHKGTIVLVACCIGLLLIVPIVWLLLPLTMLQTAEQAQAEVTSQVDEVVATIDPEDVRSDEQTATEMPCPTDEGVRAVQLRRVLVVDDTFDVGGWPQELRDRFRSSDGWHVTVHTLGGSVVISLRGSDLALVTVTADETDDGSELTMTAWSSCTAN